MEYINVSGLPDSVTSALERMVEILKQKLAPDANSGAPAPSSDEEPAPLRLGHIPGAVIGRLSRGEIYDDVA